jgi:hypothetical protein
LSDDLLRCASFRALFREFLYFVTAGRAHLAQEIASIVKDEKPENRWVPDPAHKFLGEPREKGTRKRVGGHVERKEIPATSRSKNRTNYYNVTHNIRTDELLLNR